MTYRVEPLADHDLSEFACGKAGLDDWLRRHARTATGQGTRTYVLVDEDGRAVSYFALAPHLLACDDAPPRLARGAPYQIPAMLLAKLALDSTIQGRGLGAVLLVHALDTVLAAARRAGGRVVLVDAIDDDAWASYEHHNFRRLPGHPRRLVMKLSTAAKASARRGRERRWWCRVMTSANDEESEDQQAGGGHSSCVPRRHHRRAGLVAVGRPCCTRDGGRQRCRPSATPGLPKYRAAASPR